MRLLHTAAYEAYGLDPRAQERLAEMGDLLRDAGFNVTGLSDPEAIERHHFLDSLSLVTLDPVASAGALADVGSGAGLPALVLALALPGTRITAIESSRKKCGYIERVAALLGLSNVDVRCVRAEDYGRSLGREAHDVVVSRALAALSVVAEYSLPLLWVGGVMIAMKGSVSAEERIQGAEAVGILGGGELEAVRMDPFEGSENRWAYRVRKLRATPKEYPRRAGVPSKRPLG